MGKTSIEWCGHTVNPIKGRDIALNKVGHYCEKISPGCAHCYASRLQSRFGLKEFDDPKRNKMQIFIDRKALQGVLRRRQPTVYFWEDMSDLFGEWVQDKWLDECFAYMGLTQHHTHLLLTKRVERMFNYLKHPDRFARISQVAKTIELPKGVSKPKVVWPFANVRVGASIENQPTADSRLMTLLITPAAGHFLSIEPQVGPVTLKWAACTCEDKEQAFKEKTHRQSCLVNRLPKLLNDVILGGESGPRSRPYNLQWPRSLVRQCHEMGITVFVKQLGSFPTLTPIGTKAFEKSPEKVIRLRLKSRKGSNPDEWPDDLKVREPLWVSQ